MRQQRLVALRRRLRHLNCLGIPAGRVSRLPLPQGGFAQAHPGAKRLRVNLQQAAIEALRRFHLSGFQRRRRHRKHGILHPLDAQPIPLPHRIRTPGKQHRQRHASGAASRQADAAHISQSPLTPLEKPEMQNLPSEAWVERLVYQVSAP